MEITKEGKTGGIWSVATMKGEKKRRAARVTHRKGVRLDSKGFAV